VLQTGSSYEGSWENDNYHGLGVILFDNGSSYQEGYYKDSKLNGFARV
jgi:hypothetical protein